MNLAAGFLRKPQKSIPFPLKLQPRQQELLDSKAFITLYGGQAGGGKSYGLMGGLLDLALRYPKFTGLALRKTLTEAKQPGALWPLLRDMAAEAGMKTHGTDLTATNPETDSIIKIGHMQRPNSRKSFQGSQYDVIAFDEGTHFTGEEVNWMFSRMRNPDSDMPDSETRMWITCNPDPASFLKQWLAPWVDPGHDLYPADQDATLYMRLHETPEEVTHWKERQDEDDSSIRFIPSSLSDNKYLGDAYRRNLERMTRVEKQQLLYGSWEEITGTGMYFATKHLPDTETELTGKRIRAWDTNASLSSHADFTVGVLLVHNVQQDMMQVRDVIRIRESASSLEERIVTQAKIDGRKTIVAVEQEPASQAAAWSSQLQRRLSQEGIQCRLSRVQRDKGYRVSRFASTARDGKVTLYRNRWNASYRHELVSFPDGTYDDQVDASSLAYNTLVPLRGSGPVVLTSGSWKG